MKSEPFRITEDKDSATIDMSWDEIFELLVITTKVPTGTHLGFGWGPDMIETSMVSWHAAGNESFVMELYSERNGFPSELDAACYTNTFKEEEDFVLFTSKRPIECGVNYNVISFDEEQEFSVSWKDSIWLSYHGDNRFAFKCIIGREKGLDCG